MRCKKTYKNNKDKNSKKQQLLISFVVLIGGEGAKSVQGGFPKGAK